MDDTQERTVLVSWASELRSCGMPLKQSMECKTILAGRDEYTQTLKARHDSTLLYLHGTNGNGKTHMGCVVFSLWLYALRLNAQKRMDAGEPYQRMPDGVWVTYGNLVGTMKNYGADNYDRNDLLALYTKPDVMLLDDLFSDRCTEHDIQVVNEVIDARVNYCRRTVITSNHSLLHIEEKISPRLADRLAAGAVIHYSGTSKRMKA